jgi:hypothetical protein
MNSGSGGQRRDQGRFARHSDWSEYAQRVRLVEAALGLLVVGGLAYYAFGAAGDQYPLNVAIAVLAAVVAAGLVMRLAGGGRR